MQNRDIEMIRQLNDEFRKGNLALGQWTCTPGVSSIPGQKLHQLFEKIASFDDFNQGNDPHGEHDFGAIEFEGQRYYFKIDYYDKDFEYLSENPASPNATRRRLTVMLAEEY